MFGWLGGLWNPTTKMPPNPPVPPGLRPWKGNTTAGMQQWASMIVGNPDKYPMGTIVRNSFDGRDAVARVEWHSWTHRGGKLIKGVFRGVTLYEPIESQTGGENEDDESWDEACNRTFDDACFGSEFGTFERDTSQIGFGWPWHHQARRLTRRR